MSGAVVSRAAIRANRIAFQIWALIQRTGGDCTLHDMAEATGEPWQACMRICDLHDWRGNYRSVMRITDNQCASLRDFEGTRSAVAHYAGGAA